MTHAKSEVITKLIMCIRDVSRLVVGGVVVETKAKQRRAAFFNPAREGNARDERNSH